MRVIAMAVAAFSTTFAFLLVLAMWLRCRKRDNSRDVSDDRQNAIRNSARGRTASHTQLDWLEPKAIVHLQYC